MVLLMFIALIMFILSLWQGLWFLGWISFIIILPMIIWVWVNDSQYHI